MAISCSCPDQWWRAPVYTSISIILAFIAISSAIQATHRSSIAPSILSQQLTINASQTLRSYGFTSMADLLPIFPHYFLLNPNSTVFALRDAAFSDASRPPRLIKDLLRYHVSPLTLSMDDLLKLPEGSCLPTSLPGKSVVVTRINASKRLLEINNVVVSNPDLFLGENLAIHGIQKPLSSLRSLPFPCNSDVSKVIVKASIPIKWSEVYRLLNSHGFISFSTALHSVLGLILDDETDLRSITIFAPRRLGIESSRLLHPLVDVIKFQILPRTYTFTELAAFSEETSLSTLSPGRALKVTGKNQSGDGGVRIGGLTIESPDILLSETVVVHGIARAFDMAQRSLVSRGIRRTTNENPRDDDLP